MTGHEYIRLSTNQVAWTTVVIPDEILVDFDAKGRAVGVEILGTDVVPHADHDYLSTTCYHAISDGTVPHERCRDQCKWCGSPCRCECHVKEDT